MSQVDKTFITGTIAVIDQAQIGTVVVGGTTTLDGPVVINDDVVVHASVHVDEDVTVTGAVRAGTIEQQYPPLNTLALLVPTGAVIPYAGSAAAPGGWLFCDGSEVSRTTYAALFAVIAETYGAGDALTTFNLPDLRSRVPMGAGTGPGLSARLVGTKTGTESITDVPAHTHTGTALQAGSHTHTQTSLNDDFNLTGGIYSNFDRPSYPVSDSAGATTWTNTINASGDHTHTLSINSTGSAAVNVVNPVLVLNYIIKV